MLRLQASRFRDTLLIDHSQPTYANYDVVYNTLEGIIVRKDITSPLRARSSSFDTPVDWEILGSYWELPDLRLTSDVISLEYAEQVRLNPGHNAQNFRYSIDNSVVNEVFNAILDKIIQRRGLTDELEYDGHMKVPLW